VHLTSSPAAWYAARAGGVVAYVLVTSVVLLGVWLYGANIALLVGYRVACRGPR